MNKKSIRKRSDRTKGRRERGEGRHTFWVSNSWTSIVLQLTTFNGSNCLLSANFSKNARLFLKSG